MGFMAVAFPILPGKTDAWRAWIAEIQPGGTRHAEFVASRRKLGIHERTSLQQTPMGDLVLVVLEGENPAEAISDFMSGQDEFARWFVDKVKEFHGVDLSQGLPGAAPELIVDSEA